MADERPRPARLRPGDLVRLVSPASTPDRDDVAHSVAALEALGLRVEPGRHIFDKLGYLAGRDADRLADINEAIRDPTVRAIIATRGGKGAYRIADKLDFAGMRDDPKLMIGFSETTILHLALWRHAGIPGIHGTCRAGPRFGEEASRSFRQAVLSGETVTIHAQPDEATASLTTRGRARGILLGGNLDMVAAAAGWALPDLAGAILLIEDVEKGLGHIDRHFTRLIHAGFLRGVAGIAIGQFTGFQASGGWTILDVLQDRLSPLGVPMLGGLPLGHGPQALCVPVGTEAVLDADRRTLTVASAVV